MLEGKASGGPRNGVKLSCPSRWDGRVMLPRVGYTGGLGYYPGFYKWDTDFQMWVWRPNRETSQPKKKG